MIYFLIGLGFIQSIIVVAEEEYTYENWKYHFPSGSSMGIFLAVALPLHLKGSGAFLAYNFEANYALPDYNDTRFEYPPTLQRTSRKFNVDRKLVYDAIEAKLKSHGYSGRNCILRTICEASLYTLRHINGIIGDILHILLTPSTSKNDGLLKVYEKAEEIGTNTKNCSRYEKKCSISLLDLVSTLQQAL